MQSFRARTIHTVLLSLPILLSCWLSTNASAQHYQQTNLVSDLSGKAPVLSEHLKNPWGLARSTSSFWWVSNNGDGTASTYNGHGQFGPLNVTVPAPPGQSGPSAPTGAVFNGTSDFAVASGHPAAFIFVTEDGTISAWNPSVNPSSAVLKVNNAPHAVYKGCTIAEIGARHFLYVANFNSARIEVYDTNFRRVTVGASAFADSLIPHGFAPFNIQAVGNNLYVTYAKQDAEQHDDVPGPGLGFVDVFSPSGVLLARLQHGSWMNAPWGVVLTPGEFGEFSHAVLIGNFGDGTIAAFNPVTGSFMGNMLNPEGSVLKIDGLWALGFGNDANAGGAFVLFFTAGINDEKDGLFGTLTPIPTERNEGDEP
jgi:uncharacterized protein (TIGR03118 family)